MPIRNKENETRVKEIPFAPSTIETIDTALYNFINEGLDIHVQGNKRWNKVPVRWVGKQRVAMTKDPNAKEQRSDEGQLVLPLIKVERVSFNKSQSSRGTAFSYQQQELDPKGGSSITIARRIQQKKTAEFANANARRTRNQATFPKKNKQTVYETITIPVLTYIDVTYRCTLFTEFQQQMNSMVTVFANLGDGTSHFPIRHDGHSYPSWVQEDFAFNNNSDDLATSRRQFETSIEIMTLGHLIGNEKNEDQPQIVIRENAVDVKIPRERVIFGDINEYHDDGFFRP